MTRRGADPFDGSPISGQYDWDYRRRDAERWAALYRLALLRHHLRPATHGG